MRYDSDEAQQAVDAMGQEDHATAAVAIATTEEF